jgi:NitT/TauT family transport system permease protein
LIAAAELAAVAVQLQSDSLARPSEIAVAGAAALLDGRVLRATWQTLLAAAGGLVIGGVAGLAIGTLLGISRVLDRLMLVSIETLRPIPPTALIPIALLIFGFGYANEIMIVAFATLWPMLILTRAAILAIDRRLVEVSRLLELGPMESAFKILLPAMVPRLFVALRLSVGVAIVVAVTVEIAVNPLGLGHAMMEAQQTLRPALALALVVWIGFVGWAVNAALGWLQGRVGATPASSRVRA